jgi:hypothetical protein
MREAFTSVAICIHDSVFVRDKRQTLRNCRALGITTTEALPAQINGKSRVCRRGAATFPETVPNV